MWIKSSIRKTEIKGSPYLYESWYNNGRVYLGDKVFSIMSVNYNMQMERFEAKISGDSVFAIDPSSAKKIEIRGKEFIRTLDTEFQRNCYLQNNENLDLIKFRMYKLF